MPNIRPASILAAGPTDLADVARLFRAYAAALPIDLGYQGFEAELAGLPGAYAPPGGALLLARAPGGSAIGCVALRRLAADICEMKRLYVAPEGRGLGLGRALAEAILDEAARLGHAEMRLDTLASMQAARALYAALGFEAVPAYYATPVAETVFLARRLVRADACQRAHESTK